MAGGVLRWTMGAAARGPLAVGGGVGLVALPGAALGVRLQPTGPAGARRRRAVGGGGVLLALRGAALALRLRPTAATGTLVGRSGDSGRATHDLHERFGDEAVYVLVREPVTDLVLTSDLRRVLGLE